MSGVVSSFEKCILFNSAHYVSRPNCIGSDNWLADCILRPLNQTIKYIRDIVSHYIRSVSLITERQITLNKSYHSCKL